ncbi:MAG: hypothetical protein U0236_09785 [Nitrospira sp.]
MHGAYRGLLLMFALIDGCGFADFARVSVNEPITMKDVAFIRPDQTTFAEVVAKLGTPDELLESKRGVIAVYRFLDARYSRINYGIVAGAWSPVTPDLITEGLGMRLNRLAIQLSPTWVVHRAEFTNPPDRPSRFTLMPFAR